MSLFLLMSLIWLHHQHIHPQGTHYSLTPPPHDTSTPSNASTSSISSTGSFPLLVDWKRGSDVLRVRIEPPSSEYELWRAKGWSGWWNERDRISVVRHGYDGSGTQENGADEEDDEAADGASLVAAEVSAHTSQQQSTFTLRHVNRPPNFSSSPALSSHHSRSHSHTSPTSSLASSSPSHVYEYAHHKGYFLLPASLYSRHRVVTTTVTMSASHRAFGPFPLSFFTYHLYGYDSIVLNHLIRQMRTGFMRNANNNDIYTINSNSKQQQQQQQQQHDAHSNSTAVTPVVEAQPISTLHRLGHLLYLLFFKSELLVTTLFLFFATTTLVSSTLTQTQLRMLHFTDQLRQHIRLHLPIVGLVLEHTMQSLSFVPVVVGILFFLFEFFNDQVLAFLLLMLVWLCESYTVLFTRTTTSMLYFPKLFALYFLMFSVYFFSFPYGFHYIAMGLTASQLYTCILYYWFEYEIPAVEAGDISIHRPRMLVLRRADGGEREREEASASHARGDSSNRRGAGGSREASTVQRGRERVAGRRDELFARLLSLSEERDVQRSAATSETAVRHSDDAVDDSDANEFEFSRRPLPRISTSSSALPARSSAPLGPASAVSHSASSLPVPSALSVSASAPGQQQRRSSGATTSSLIPESASPIPSASPSPMPTSVTLPLLPSSPTPSVLPSEAQADAALQRLQSLPPLLHTLLRQTQQLKAQYAPPASPRHSQLLHSSSHRARAASAVSPTLSPLPHKDERILPDTATLALTLPALSLVTEESKEQPALMSPRAGAAGLLSEPAGLHKLMLDQLSNVLQVALYALTALVHNPPAAAHTPAASLSSVSHSAAIAAAPASLSLPLSSEVGAGGSAAVHSLPVPTSPVSRSPRSPHSSPTPPPAPRSSPPSSHRTSNSQQQSVSSAAPVRRLTFYQRPSAGDAAAGAVGPALAAAAAVSGSAGNATARRSGDRSDATLRGSEPVSPDPAADAPMM